MLAHLPRSFVLGEYKRHRSTILFEREASYFPQTMEFIRQDKERQEIQTLISHLQEQKRGLLQKIRQEQERLLTLSQHPQNTTSSHFQRGCAAVECRGYVDGRNGLCAICQCRTCLSCNVLIGKGEDDGATTTVHTCREEDRLNWEHIQKHTKPCPNCTIRIHRISGCKQMWCPQCHTAFDYVTSKIERGTIHNPHYFEFVRTHGAEALLQENQPVARQDYVIPSVSKLLHVTKKRPDRTSWSEFQRLLFHIRREEVPRYRYASTTPFHDTTLVLRKQFLQNQLSEAIFKKKIQEKEKKWLKDGESFMVFHTFYTLGAELLRSLALYHSEATWKQKALQRQQLCSFFNDGMKEISLKYQNCSFFIHPLTYELSRRPIRRHPSSVGVPVLGNAP